MQFEGLRSYVQELNLSRFVIVIFAILGLIGILNHDMWRDEMNTWLIVRDSSTFLEMLSYVNYQGHPALWATLVSLAKTFANIPVSMQILHWGLGTSAIVVFWYYSSFTPLQKVLFSFGYLPFYEYLLISRPYVLGMLFVFLFCALYPSRERSYLGIAIVLGLMANSHAFAALISLGGFLALCLEFVLDQEHRSTYKIQSNRYDLFLSLTVFIASYTVAFLILSPPIDSEGVGGWKFAFDLHHLFKVFGRLSGGYVLLIPNSRRWLDLIVCDVLGLSIFLLTAIKLIYNRTVFLFYILSTGALLSFFYLRFMGQGARHYGYLYLVLIAALWLVQYQQKSNWITIDTLKLGKRSFSVKKCQQIIFILILLVHFCGGLYRFPLDLAIPFSAGREAAQYILESNLEAEFIVASPDVNMASISGYLNRQLYYPELQGMGSFTIFQKGRRIAVNQNGILEQITTLLPTVENQRILLILTQELEATHPNLQIVSLAKFVRSWHRGERMYLYWVKELGNSN